MRYSLLLIFLLFISSCNPKPKQNESDFMTGDPTLMITGLPDAPRWVDDSENIFSREEKQTLNDLSNLIFEETGFIPMIHTTGQTEPYSNLNEYTSAIDQAWADKSGKYFIIIVSAQLEEVRFIQGEITESALPVDFIDRVMQTDLFPEFRKGSYAKGIENALNSYQTALKAI